MSGLGMLGWWLLGIAAQAGPTAPASLDQPDCEIADDLVICKPGQGLLRFGRLRPRPAERALGCSCDGIEAMVMTDRALWTIPLVEDREGRPGDPIQISYSGMYIDLTEHIGPGSLGWVFGAGCLHLLNREPAILRVCPKQADRDRAVGLRSSGGIDQAALDFERGLLVALVGGEDLWVLDMDLPLDRGLVSLELPGSGPAALLRQGESLYVTRDSRRYEVQVGDAGVEEVVLRLVPHAHGSVDIGR